MRLGCVRLLDLASVWFLFGISKVLDEACIFKIGVWVYELWLEWLVDTPVVYLELTNYYGDYAPGRGLCISGFSFSRLHVPTYRHSWSTHTVSD